VPPSIEKALLLEALSGATRSELVLAAKAESIRVTFGEVRRTMEALERDGALTHERGWWTTTDLGRERLQELEPQDSDADSRSRR
jgi:predicted ArsR family transcriptional regulator